MTTDTPPGGGKLVDTLPFTPVRIAVLTVSDTRDEESDTSGKVLADRVSASGHILAERGWVRDECSAIVAALQQWVRDPNIQAIITTGGTGLTGRDVTPEAARKVFTKEIEGFQYVWHFVSYQSVGTSTLQSRACAGIADSTYIFCLPGSNGACRDGWDKIIRWQLNSQHMPCNMVEIMPRLMER